MPILVALGGADCVWDDLAAAEALLQDRDYDVGAVNDAGAHYQGKLTLWCSLHPENMGAWVQRRPDRDFASVCHREHRNFRADHIIVEIWSGSSGLYICQVAAITFGYDRIICCGIPMTETPHFFASKPWADGMKYRRGWVEAHEQPELKDKIRSMSGWTAGVVGKPTRRWLDGPD